MEKKMFALTWCYEGVDDNNPVANTIAVSEDREKLVEKMRECVEYDTQDDEEDEWDDDKNYRIHSQNEFSTILQHKQRINLYTSYHISSVEVL